MNSNIDGVSDAFQDRFLRHLLGEMNPENNAVNFDTRPTDENDAVSRLSGSPAHSDFISSAGEVPAVQDRFHALLKSRLQQEAELNPPCFPWETEVREYTDTLLSPQWGVWLPQVQQWAARLPEATLVGLLERCQSVAQLSLQEGVRLVRAVEELFPNADKALNHQMAGSALRFAETTRLASDPAEADRERSQRLDRIDYETADRNQQMLLAMIAANELFDALAIELKPDGKPVERSWQTSLGELRLQVEWRSPEDTRPASLAVACHLPCAGRIELLGDRARATAESSTTGPLRVELDRPQVGRPYPLQVYLYEPNDPSLTFSIALDQS